MKTVIIYSHFAKCFHSYALIFWPHGQVKEVLDNSSHIPELRVIEDFRLRLNNAGLNACATLCVNKKEYFELRAV